jgi:hypothetical protein
MQTTAAQAPILLAVLIALDASCSRAPQFTEYDEQANARARSAPLVAIGVADADVPIGGEVPSRFDPQYPMQLHRVRVRIENVLKGSLREQVIDVYYFGFAGGLDGPRPLGFGPEPSRRIFWLKKEGPAFRMACDGWDYCTTIVSSGAHLQYKADSAKPLEYALADILLTRGEGEISNLKFAGQISQGVPDRGIQGFVIEKLTNLAHTESLDVKSSACELIWTYTRDRTDNRIRDRAQDSLRTANCHCRVKLDGNVSCD